MTSRLLHGVITAICVIAINMISCFIIFKLCNHDVTPRKRLVMPYRDVIEATITPRVRVNHSRENAMYYHKQRSIRTASPERIE